MAALVLAAGCAVEHARTDLVPLKRADRTSPREAGDVTVVMCAVPALTYNGYVDERAILWQAVCGLRAYPGDESAKLPDLLTAGGVMLRQNLTASAGRCSDELVRVVPRR